MKLVPFLLGSFKLGLPVGCDLRLLLLPLLLGLLYPLHAAPARSAAPVCRMQIMAADRQRQNDQNPSC